MLGFADLQQSLRQLLSVRIESGELTGVELAHRTGFRPAHISNFLNRKRALSLEGLDNVLRAEKLSLLDLISPDEILERTRIPSPPDHEYADLLVLDPKQAMTPNFMPSDEITVEKFPSAILRNLDPNLRGQRAHWQRFVLMKPSRADCVAMSPRLAPGCTVLLDRYNNAVPWEGYGRRSMFAIWKNGETVVRYAKKKKDVLILRPHALRAGKELLRVEGPIHGPVIGRVAFVQMAL